MAQQVDIKEVIESITSDIKFLMETINSHLPESDIKALVQGQLLTVNKLLSSEFVPANKIPSLRSRNGNPLSQTIRQMSTDDNDLPKPVRSLANEWAANLPERPSVRPKQIDVDNDDDALLELRNSRSKNKKKKDRPQAPDRNGNLVTARSSDDVEVHEAPGHAKCPGCGLTFVDEEGTLTHAINQNFPEHKLTNMRPVQACTGDVIYLVG